MGRYDQFDQPKRINPLRVLLIILIIALVVGVGYMFYPMEDDDGGVEDVQKSSTRREIPLKIPIKESPPGAQQSSAESDSALPLPPAPSPEYPPLRTELPSLQDSDPILREDIETYVPELLHWFGYQHLIKNYLTVVNDLAQGQRPYKNFRFLRLPQAFKVLQDKRGLAIDPLGYQRYNELANAVAELDVAISIKLYRTYQPLLEQVFAKFGYPFGHTLDDLFLKAIAQVLNAPVIEKRIGLIKHVKRYKFASKKLESLNPVHKQMLRMGPENTRKIQLKLRQFAQALAGA